LEKEKWEKERLDKESLENERSVREIGDFDGTVRVPFAKGNNGTQRTLDSAVNFGPGEEVEKPYGSVSRETAIVQDLKSQGSRYIQPRIKHDEEHSRGHRHDR